MINIKKRLSTAVLVVTAVLLLMQVTRGRQTADASNSETNNLSFSGAKSQWEGFDRYDFRIDGRAATIIAPKHPLPGRPWLWRGEFFGVYANADATLVTNGFFLAFLEAPDLFGSPQAVKLWDAFYRELTEKHGFAKKTALIGISRGGLYCYNWAIANPEKVAMHNQKAKLRRRERRLNDPAYGRGPGYHRRGPGYRPRKLLG